MAQAVLDALAGDPVIVPAHGTPLTKVGDVARVWVLVEPLAKSAVS